MPDILNMAFYTALEVRENEYDYLIIAQTNNPPRCCPHCQSLEYNKHGTREPVFMDTPIHGKRVGIKIMRQRYRCKSCENVFVDRLIGMNEDHMMTNRLVLFIEEECLKRTFTSIADDVGIDEKTIRKVFKARVSRYEAEYKVITPDWLGIDEIHILGNPRCVLTNVKEHTLIDMLKTRNKPVVEKYLLSLPDRKRIEVVTMDMWMPYREAVQGTIPQAKIVVDRYHVVRMANKGLDELRKSLKAGMTTSQKRQLMRDRYILLKRHRDLEAKDLLLLDTWLGNIPQLEVAYRLKEIFFDLYEIKDKKEAEERYTIWSDTVAANPDIAPYFEDLIRAVTNWHDPIFNFFDFQITNGYTEAMNGLIKIANRIGRGYSFEAIRAKMLFRNGHKKKPNFREGGRVLQEQIVNDDPHILANVLQPIPRQAPDDLGVPITTLTEMIDRHEL